MNVVLTGLPTVESLSQLLLVFCGRCRCCFAAEKKVVGNRDRAMSDPAAVADPELPWLVEKLLKTLLITGAVLVALRFTDAATIISILGGSVASLLMFWLPSVIYL